MNHLNQDQSSSTAKLNVSGKHAFISATFGSRQVFVGLSDPMPSFHSRIEGRDGSIPATPEDRSALHDAIVTRAIEDANFHQNLRQFVSQLQRVFGTGFLAEPKK